MTRLQQTLILLTVIALPAAALSFVLTAAPVMVEPDAIAPVTAGASPLCFSAGAVTYRLSSGTPTPDYRVRIGMSDPAANSDLRSDLHSDLHIQIVDSVEAADFALVDGGTNGGTCASAGATKTVQVVDDASPADVTLDLSREGSDADLKLFVRSTRFGDRDAAALFAAMRLHQSSRKLAEYR